MLVRTKQGIVKNAYPVSPRGPWYCGWCFRRMELGEQFTRRELAHPWTGEAVIHVICRGCEPFEPTYYPIRRTTWVREAPNDIQDVRTEAEIPTPPKLNALIKKVRAGR